MGFQEYQRYPTLRLRRIYFLFVRFYQVELQDRLLPWSHPSVGQRQFPTMLSVQDRNSLQPLERLAGKILLLNYKLEFRGYRNCATNDGPVGEDATTEHIQNLSPYPINPTVGYNFS